MLFFYFFFPLTIQGLWGLSTVTKVTDDIQNGTKGKKMNSLSFSFHSFPSALPKELVEASEAAATQARSYFHTD